MPVIESLLPIPAAAKLAGISARTFWKMIAENRTPEVVRIGRSVRLRASDIDLWIKLGCPDRRDFESHRTAQREVRSWGAAKGTFRFSLPRWKLAGKLRASVKTRVK